MTRLEYFEKAKAAKKLYEEKATQAENALKSLITEKGPMGLVPDHIKFSPEYQAAKIKLNNALNDLRNFNQNYCKTFKAELKAERDEKRLNYVRS